MENEIIHDEENKPGISNLISIYSAITNKTINIYLYSIISETIEKLKSFVNSENRIIKTCFEKGATFFSAGNYAQSNKYFSKMHEIFIDIKGKKLDNTDISILSMGMSGDYKQAVLHGSNLVRVGSAIFGARIYK